MTSVYIVSQNGVLSSENSLLIYTDHSGLKKKLLTSQIFQIVLCGKTTITSGAFSLIFLNKINVVFLNRNDKFNAQLYFADSKNVLLRHAQHILLEDKEKVCSVSKDIVRGKIHNQYLFLQRIARKNLGNRMINDSMYQMKRCRNLLEKAKTINEIRGLEGECAHLYFDCLSFNITCGWTSFTGRNKNPPKDPVNAVLSFVYTLLASRISSYIHEIGLDSSVGTLHALSYGRESLVYDLLEEFRTPIADTLTCALFNMKILNSSDFRYGETENDDEEELVEQSSYLRNAVLLTENGMKKVITQLERKLEDEHDYPLKSRVMSYDKIIKAQVAHYKDVVLGIQDHYLPVIIT